MGETSILHNVVGPARVEGNRSRWLGSPAAVSRIVILNGLADRWEARSSGGAFSIKWGPDGRASYATPMRYAEALRLDRAAERLRRGEGLVDDIAYAAGYDSPSAFGRAFRRRFGTTPSAFRQAAR